MNSIDKWSILAGVRFVLASIVAINHMVDYVPLGLLGFVPMFGAFEAILGFLLISGYSISVSYAKQPEGFLWRRVRRLYPIYLAAIALSCVADVVLKVPTPGLVTLLKNALFLNQLLTKTSFVGPAWSLSLEFWLYCLAPFLMRLSKAVIRAIVCVSFVSYLIYTVLRTVLHMPYYSGVGFGANLVFLSFIWVAGLRLARADGDEDVAMRDIGLIFGLHIGLSVVIKLGSCLKRHEVSSFFYHDLIVYVMQAVTLVCVYLVFKHLVIANRPGLHRSWFLRMLGDISYPLYVLHAALYGILLHLGLTMPIMLYLTAVLVSAAVYWSLDFYSKARHQQIGTN